METSQCNDSKIKLIVEVGTCSLATALSAARTLLAAAPVFTACTVEMKKQNQLKLSVTMTLQINGHISETYNDEQMII